MKRNPCLIVLDIEVGGRGGSALKELTIGKCPCARNRKQKCKKAWEDERVRHGHNSPCLWWQHWSASEGSAISPSLGFWRSGFHELWGMCWNYSISHLKCLQNELPQKEELSEVQVIVPQLGFHQHGYALQVPRSLLASPSICCPGSIARVTTSAFWEIQHPYPALLVGFHGIHARSVSSAPLLFVMHSWISLSSSGSELLMLLSVARNLAFSSFLPSPRCHSFNTRKQ